MDDVDFNSMHGRGSSVETHMEFMRRDVGDIKADITGNKADLRSVIKRLDELPTTRELAADRWQWAGLSLAASALIVTGIIGGLGWLETRTQKIAPPPPAPQPIVI